MRSQERQGRRLRSARATAGFFAFTAPFGIIAHLVSEFAGLGWHDDADVLFSARHGYLAALAIASLGALVFALFAIPGGERRERIAALIDALPFRGRGIGFTTVSFVAQFGFFALTQIGEGCPLCSGDVVTGAFAAAIAAALGALLVTFGKRRLLELAFSIVRYLCILIDGVVDAATRSRTVCVAPRAGRRRTPFAFRYRPPPASLRSPLV